MKDMENGFFFSLKIIIQVTHVSHEYDHKSC